MLPLIGLACSILLTSFTTPAQAATTCNGYPDLCNRSYSNVTFLGAHDSYAVGSSLADDQSVAVTQQLNDGLRTFQVQMHNASDGIHLCHTSCTLLDGGTLQSWLSSVATWVSSNPDEVITLVLVNYDDLPPTSFTSAFQSSGIQSHVYSPPSASTQLSAWPTLGTLIDAGTTVVVFMDFEADFSSVPWIIDEFSNMFEDAYDVTDTTWSCAVNRSNSSPSSSLMMVNHFLDVEYDLGTTAIFIPNKDQINVTNSQSSLSEHVDNCQMLWGRNPNHILLDFYNAAGNTPFDYVASLNSLPQPTSTVQAESIPSSTSSGSAQISTSSLSTGAANMAIGGVTTLGITLVTLLSSITIGMLSWS